MWSRSLLLVDDESSILKALQRLFRRNNITVITANDGETALEALDRGGIAVILSDMKMPGMSGAEFLTQAGKIAPDTVRIALTGYADMQDAIDLINRAGVYRYVSKPWDDVELIALVNEAFALYEDKKQERVLQEYALRQNQDLKSRNTRLKKEVQHNIAQLEKASDKLASAYEGEKKLRLAREQAEQLNEAKSRFLATMSHEMRSPLNAIIAMNALLLESPLNDEQRELAKLAYDGGQTLLALINDILDFSKIEAGKLQLHQQWFNLIDVIESVAELMSSQTIDKPVEIATIVAPGTPTELFGDETRVKQIFLNLVSNAVKFTDNGGVKIHVAPEKQGVEVKVLDTGIGISPEEQSKVFDKFFQADNTDSRIYGGTGLGLSICSELLRMMAGDISLQSEKGKGSTFTFHLPLKSRAPINFHAGTAKKLIYVDTRNELLVESIREQLHYLNCDVISHHDEAVTLNVQAYAAFVLLADIIDLNETASSRLEDFYHRIANTRLSQFQWDIIALLAKDAVGVLGKIKQNGFQSVFRKPMLMSNFLMLANQKSNNPCTPLNASRDAHQDLTEKAISDNHEAELHTDELMPILLVEDSPTNQAVIKAILKSKPYSIDIANNGVEALEMVEHKHYHLILMDLAMPVMDGITTTKKIRANTGANQNTRIIAMTANAFAEDRERCLKAGMNDYISKPLDVAQFLQSLRLWAKTSQRNKQSTPERLTTKKTNGSKTDAVAELLIDRQILHQLIRDTSTEALPDILDIYFKETNKRIPIMLGLADAKSWQALADQAHTLKSSSGSFGAFVLQEKSRLIEVGIKENHIDQAEIAMTDIAPVAEATIAQLKAFCQEVNSGNA